MTVEAFAPAKINLTLHVTGQRADGYHLLDSLVVFADVGDRITARQASEYSLTVDGPNAAGVPPGADNLVFRAAKLFGKEYPTELQLTKILPSASGIGGGSSDAAAAIRAMFALHKQTSPDQSVLLSLGSDVPVCGLAKPVRMSGIGESLSSFAPPAVHMILVNSGVTLATPDVFSALESKINPTMPSSLPDWSDATDFCSWLVTQRNDLEAPAISLAPEIQQVLHAIAATNNCLLSRMSGSGATCFGLYRDAAAARTAMSKVQGKFPDWWVVSADLWKFPN
jgi:4-diphosphocytidyl-2-C-methyl-D-erythritol kinase